MFDMIKSGLLESPEFLHDYQECLKLMNENLTTRGPAVDAEQPVDVY